MTHEEYIVKRSKAIQTAMLYAYNGGKSVGDVHQAFDELVLSVIGADDVPRNTIEHSRRNYLRLQQTSIVKGNQ